MRIADIHRAVGIRFRARCSGKVVYPLRPDAELAARMHNYQFICEDMQAYWCILHQCWHIGHKDKRSYAHAMIEGDYLWFIDWEANSAHAV